MGGLDIEYDEMNCPSSGRSPQPLPEKVSEMTLDSVSMFKSSIGADTFFTSSWEPPLSLSHCEFSSSPYSLVLENEGANTTSRLVHDPLNLSYDMFGSGSFSEMVASFGLVTEGGQSQIANIKCSFSYVPNLEAGGSERASKNDAKAQVDCLAGSSPDEKRRKLALGSTPFSPNKTAGGRLNMEPIGDFSDILKKEKDKIPNLKHRICANFHSKSDGKQATENCHSVQAANENYIHVRARRGQATNSHSLAERVRREKIGERMKLLQELVPGCNKIAGKAVMLDEIINYVQSLQQQVEFLSMKLANVNPELNLDTQQILLTDIFHLQDMDGVLAIDPRSTASHTVHQGMFQLHGIRPAMTRISQQFSSLPQTAEMDKACDPVGLCVEIMKGMTQNR